MRLKNILIVVKDIDLSKAFYRDLFGLHVVTDMGENVILTEGLVLQERTLWEEFTSKKVSPGGHDAELYFEESNMDTFLQKLEKCKYDIQYMNAPEVINGQTVVRIYDPDMHVIEVKG